MPRILFPLLAVLLLGASLDASAARASDALPPASFSAAQSLYAASSSPGNEYVAGASVVLTAPVAGDFSAFGGSIVSAAPVAGDDLLVAGSIHSRAPVEGDVRALGGTVTIDGRVKGDLAVLGYTVDDLARADGSVFIAAVNTTIADGAAGPVTLYGNNISLAGTFDNNVTIYASGRVTLMASTTIHGTLAYEAPEPATIPPSAIIDGGVKYTNASYLPTIGTSRILALLNMGFFLFARFLGALLLAGLLAGLFPRLAEAIIERAYTDRPQSMLLTILLGFAIVVVTPVLCIMLTLTFVGIGLALLLCILYALLVMLALLYSGILIGGVLVRRFARRDTVLWRDGVLGMFILSLITLIPVVGLFVAGLLALFAAGALLQLFFHVAFPGENYTEELL
ncbi:hypothetical protein KGM48_03955 [Patescibacteria group bacterium]|nr:hypothetical protein [Patescibacteria group bacterium]